MTETPVPLPPGVLGYVVAFTAAKASLTHSSLMPRAEAEQEAGQWSRSAVLGGGRYVVCEVREVAA